MKKLTLVILAVIFLLAAGLRFYKLGQVPPSLSWDETAVGYNAWTILYWAKDEWGRSMPLVFKSFEDYKHPVHIYLTVPTVAIFGPNEIGVRASSAFFGFLNVVLIFFLARKILKSDTFGLLAAFFLAISPYNIHFSRFNHELNFAVFFFMLGLYLILKGIQERNYYLILGFASLGLDLLTYHSAKAVVPSIFLLLIIIYFKDFLQAKKYFLWGLAAFSFFVSLLFIEPQLLGLARLGQTSAQGERTIQAIFKKYATHFSYSFLFEKGDPNPRLSPQTGTFYKPDMVFLAVGLLYLLWGILKHGKREFIIILAWALVAPIPAAVTSEVPHAARAMFMTGSWHLISALGAYTIINSLRNRYLKVLAGLLIVGVLGVSLVRFLEYYFDGYAKRYAIEWQYGMKQIVEYVKKHPEYIAVFTTPERQQPYIFYLFYYPIPLPTYLGTVRYNNTISRPANTVDSFSDFHFVWDPIESAPTPGVLYVVTPAQYTGLRYTLLFDTVYAVKYPNGTDAFFLVTAKSTFNQ